MHKKISSVLVNFLGTLVCSSACVGCGVHIKYDEYLCAACIMEITPVPHYTLGVTKQHQMRVFAVGQYQGVLKSLILAKKYGDVIRTQVLGMIMSAYASQVLLDVDYIVPIPLHWTRYAWRGYNHAEIIAQHIGVRSETMVVPILTRVKRTLFSPEADFAARIHNVSDAFRLSRHHPYCFQGKHILLVDDILTSGATLQHAAQLIYTLGPAQVSGIVAARTG